MSRTLDRSQGKFEAMPVSDGAPIVESGSNADGEWTRWSDGTQAVQMTGITVTKGSGYSSTDVLFPQTFNAAPIATASVNFKSADGGGSRTAYVVSCWNDTTSDTEYAIDLIDGGSAGSGAWSGNRATAIGRWK